MAALGQHIQLRHQLGADDRQHLLHLVAVLCGEPLTHSLDDGVQVGVADAVVIDVFLGGAQIVLAAVGGGLDLLHIALFHEAADLVGCVGSGNAHHAGELRNGRLAHRHDALHAEGLHRGQRGLAGGKALKYILIKVQLEFGINVLKDFFQHGFSFHEPNSSKNLLFLQYTMILAGGEEKNPRFWWKF